MIVKLIRVKSATIRYLLSRQESPLPIKLLTQFFFMKKKIMTVMHYYGQPNSNRYTSFGRRTVYH